MAFCMGYNLAGEFRSISSTARIIVATLGRTTSKLHNVSCKANKHRSIAERIVKCTARTQSSTTSILRATLTEYDQKIEAIRHLLTSKGEADPIERLMFVDALQRLGISHHFEEETDTILRRISNRHGIHTTLYDVSLFFRLLRQHGHYISSEVFNDFKGEDGEFKEELKLDMRGLVELYEASHLSFEGEYSLEKAKIFSYQILKNSLPEMDDSFRASVANKLRHPSHKNIARFITGRDFHDDIESTYEWGETLREMAELDLLVGRSIYQEESLQVSKWWNELGLCKKLTLARNRPLEFYTWSMVILIDYIELSEHRTELTKSVAFIYMIDDIFDVYGTPNELTVFTEAVNKWDYAAADTLPDYMKMCYIGLLDTINGTCQRIYEKHGHNPIENIKRTWASLCNAFLEEAKWSASGNLPNADEYLINGKISSGVYILLVHLFFLMGLDQTNGVAIQLSDTWELMSSVATIVRLWNDIGSAKNEHQNGNDGSYLACYKKDHISLSAAQAKEHALDLVAIEWKRLNEESLKLNHIALSSFKQAALNFARMVPLMYSYHHDDGQHSILEEHVEFLIYNTTSLNAII